MLGRAAREHSRAGLFASAEALVDARSRAAEHVPDLRRSVRLQEALDRSELHRLSGSPQRALEWAKKAATLARAQGDPVRIASTLRAQAGGVPGARPGAARRTGALGAGPPGAERPASGGAAGTDPRKRRGERGHGGVRSGSAAVRLRRASEARGPVRLGLLGAGAGTPGAEPEAGRPGAHLARPRVGPVRGLADPARDGGRAQPPGRSGALRRAGRGGDAPSARGLPTLRRHRRPRCPGGPVERGCPPGRARALAGSGERADRRRGRGGPGVDCSPVRPG